MSFDTPTPQAPYTSSDPHATYLNASCLEFLLIELVPTSYRMAAEMAAREEEWTRPLAGAGAGAGAARSVTSAQGQGQGAGQAGTSGGTRSRSSTVAATATSTAGGIVDTNGTAGGGGVDEEEVKENVAYRLDMLGYRVGLGIVERFSRDKPRFTETLDVIKFLCKDLWTIVFRKQIDNLKTNHRGIYVLTDASFRPLNRMSLERGQSPDVAIMRAQPFLFFPAGLVRGALAAMGITASVTAETSQLPGVTFQIKTLGAKA